MKASNPRTYSRKRKDAAEAKFDALFATTEPTSQGNDIKKRKTKQSDTTITLTSLPKVHISNGSPTKSLKRSSEETAAQKFDAVFGMSPSKRNTRGLIGNSQKSTSDDDNSVEITRTMYTSIRGSQESKYDALFKKNEKSASDKFDALFGDDDVNQTQTSLPPKPKAHRINPAPQNPDFDNLFGFDVETTPKAKSLLPPKPLPSIQLSPKKIVLSPVSQLSPTKSLPYIRATSTKTLDGKVLLNIQRGGKKTVETSPKKSSQFSTDTTNNLPAINCAEKVSPYNDQFKSIKGVGNMIQVDLSKAASAKKCVKVKTEPSSTTENIKKNSLRKFSKAVVKSTAKQNSASKASYNSRPWMPDSEESIKKASLGLDSQSLSQPSRISEEPVENVPSLTRSVTWPENIGESIVTSIKCNKNAKEYYTVVKHVKNYQHCLDEGEAQEFEDEVDYILDGLQTTQPTSIRCLSTTNLANKCQQHNFRLYLRAHNIVPKVFKHLHDSVENKSLSLATASLLFMLSRDRQMEIDKTTLQLLLRLLDPLERESNNLNGVPQAETTKAKPVKYKIFKTKVKGDSEMEDTKNLAVVENKVKELIEACGDALLTINDVSMKRLASEALLRFTARRTTEWFREEVRLKGGLDHIISLVQGKVDLLVPSTNVTEDYRRTLSLLERILKVLENAIVNSPRNAMYLVTHQRALLLKKLATLLQMSQKWLRHHPGTMPQASGTGETPSIDRTYMALRNCVLQVVKLLVNISNDSEWVSTKVGDQDSLLPSIVHCVITTPAYLEESHQYELILLSLSLLVNLVESSAKNRMTLMKMTVPKSRSCSGGGDAPESVSVVQAFVELFCDRESAASENEILGEEGVKKAVEAKKISAGSKDSDAESLSGSQRGEFQTETRDGRWIESDEGMEWVPNEDADNNDDERSLAGSQESIRSASRNPESALTAEEKSEMKQTLSKANEHMEHSIVAAYAALVLGCLVRGNRGNVAIIRQHLRGDADLQPMIAMLKKFLTFMKITAGMSQKGEKTLTQIIEDLEEENVAT